jgi:hypothetical protein
MIPAFSVGGALAAAGAGVSSEVEPYTPMENLSLIVQRPDNVPIVLMVLIFGFFTCLALRQAFKHDRLIKEGRKQDILKSMQE